MKWRPPDRWAPFLDRLAADDYSDVLLARNEGAAVGMAFVGIDPETAVMSIGGMWVELEGRRIGVGRALVDAAIVWGLEKGATRTRLAVSIGNHAAERLYESAGFASTGETEPLREGSSTQIVWMERPL